MVDKVDKKEINKKKGAGPKEFKTARTTIYMHPSKYATLRDRVNEIALKNNIRFSISQFFVAMADIILADPVLIDRIDLGQYYVNVVEDKRATKIRINNEYLSGINDVAASYHVPLNKLINLLIKKAGPPSLEHYRSFLRIEHGMHTSKPLSIVLTKGEVELIQGAVDIVSKEAGVKVSFWDIYRGMVYYAMDLILYKDETLDDVDV